MRYALCFLDKDLRFYISVEAEHFEEAKDKASQMFEWAGGAKQTFEKAFDLPDNHIYQSPEVQS